MSLFETVKSCQRKGETNTALCNRMGINYRTLQDIEIGRMPKVDTLMKMASGLDVHVCWLLRPDGPQTEAEYEEMVRYWTKRKAQQAAKKRRGGSNGS